MLDDIGGEPCGNGEGKIDEKNGSLSQVFISVVIIEFGDHILQRVERREHDHEADTEVRDAEVLLALGEAVLLKLGHGIWKCDSYEWLRDFGGG